MRRINRRFEQKPTAMQKWPTTFLAHLFLRPFFDFITRARAQETSAWNSSPGLSPNSYSRNFCHKQKAQCKGCKGRPDSEQSQVGNETTPNDAFRLRDLILQSGLMSSTCLACSEPSRSVFLCLVHVVILKGTKSRHKICLRSIKFQSLLTHACRSAVCFV